MRSIHVLALTLLVGGTARADILTVWAAGKGAMIGGSGDLYERFDSAFGAGVEGGIEVIGIDLWGEALAFGTDQFLMTANLGFDLTFGDDNRFSLGVFTGPMFFVFPEQTTPNGLNLANLPDAAKRELAAQGISTRQIEDEYDRYADQYEVADRLAVGWNLARARLQFEHGLTGPFWIGVTGQMGYHLVLSGEDAAADAKGKAIDAYAEDKGLSNALAKDIKDAAGAKDVDTGALNGLNWDVGLFFKVEL